MPLWSDVSVCKINRVWNFDKKKNIEINLKISCKNSGDGLRKRWFINFTAILNNGWEKRRKNK